jgi:hypothetical protein
MNKNSKKRKTSTEEKISKCKYVNQLFPLSLNTCNVPPNFDYKNLYSKSYKMEMWKFQQSDCQPDDYIVFKIVVILLFWYGVHSTWKNKKYNECYF